MAEILYAERKKKCIIIQKFGTESGDRMKAAAHRELPCMLSISKKSKERNSMKLFKLENHAESYLPEDKNWKLVWSDEFDGTELDSGTVAEFMLAKFAAMPALLLRTDFRVSGDQNVENSGFEPWNLMLSFYPHTKSLLLNAASLYRRSFEGDTPNLNTYADLIAREIIAKLDELARDIPASKSMPQIREWICEMSDLNLG